MSFDYTLSDELEAVLARLTKRDRQLALAVVKKIEQVAALDESTINHLKNLKGDLQDYKIVHVGSFVLMFKVLGEHILFDKLLHHDEAYRRV
jgi:mRNA-degrading endonuclease RelE of RelBE toxin-antitoxin system